MATLTPSEKHWQVAPTRCLPSPSILTRFATESTAGWQAPRNRQLPFDRLMPPFGSFADFVIRLRQPIPEDTAMMDPKLKMDVPPQVREFAQKSVDQAERAISSF